MQQTMITKCKAILKEVNEEEVTIFSHFPPAFPSLRHHLTNLKYKQELP